MSSLSRISRIRIEAIFGMKTGYVGRYSNKAFGDLIFQVAGIDVYEGKYDTDDCSSKAKKLRRLIDMESDECVSKVLAAMLDERDISLKEQQETVGEIKPDPYESDVKEVRQELSNMQIGVQYRSNEERLLADISSSRTVLRDLISVSESICNNAHYCPTTEENTINDYYRDMLKSKGYQQVFDQTRHGISATGKKAGSVDLLLEIDGKEIAIIEAFRLNTYNSTTICTHIEKAIVNYNSLGTPTFLLIYSGDRDFQDMWKKVLSFLQKCNFVLTVKRPIEEHPYPNASTRVCDAILCRDDYDFPIIFLMVNLYKDSTI